MPNYSIRQVEKYSSALAKIASLSNLFSESQTPFIHYRVTEYLYSNIFNAKNLNRSDIAIDAKLGNVGVGLKTFVYYNRPKYEKIAEFNKDLLSYSSLSDLEKIRRIEVAGKLSMVDSFIYHCIARLPGKLFVFEEEMPLINLDRLRVTSVRGATISFTDEASNYRFSSSKSTLFKEFSIQKGLFEKPVIIYDNPLDLLDKIVFDEKPMITDVLEFKEAKQQRIVLPLYSKKNGKSVVFSKSGLNQWNASGRKRDFNEVYIPIPAEVRQKLPNFLPDRSTPFQLNFPDGHAMSMKVSQENGKALMSQHNADLGQWLLRDILGLREGELLTYKNLEDIGIDSVEISKINGQYSIDFKQIGSYEQFIEDLKIQ